MANPAVPQRGPAPIDGPYSPGWGIGDPDEAEDYYDDGAIVGPSTGGFTGVGGGIFTAVVLIILFLFFAIVVMPVFGAVVW